MLQQLLPTQVRAALSLWKSYRLGRKFAKQSVWQRHASTGTPTANDLRQFFRDREVGAGIWKWDHYFDIYDRHFNKFRGKPVRILEVGIYSGGSLDMWQAYFGDQAEIFGVDIEMSCRSYERKGVKVFIGDQADRAFWRRFRSEVAGIDIVIDDGGHEPHQQSITMEELVPYMNPGGIYICEDAHGVDNKFVQQVFGLASQLNSMDGLNEALDNPDRRLVVPANSVQALIESISIYPYVVAIELRDNPLVELIAPKRGTQWQPFLK